MDLSNGTTALGIAVALGEIEMPRQEQVMRDLSLYSAVASCSSGVELDRAQIVVVGNARGHGGAYPIGHSVRSEEHTSEFQSRHYLVCRLLLEKKIYAPYAVWSALPLFTLP